MTYSLSQLPGLTPVEKTKLKKLGIRTTEALFEYAITVKGRKDLETKTGIKQKQLLNWVHLCDYMRVPGMGVTSARLVRAAGVPSVREFVYRNPGRLAQSMAEANETHKLVRILPSEEKIKSLIAEARKLEMKVKY